jgi:tryptophan-associated transmembrane protein
VSGPAGAATARRPSRALAAVCAALALSAAALGGAAALTWARAEPPGRAPVELSGALVAPSLTGIALLALAGVAGVVAAGGVLRRLLGLLLAAAGAAVVAATASAVADPVAAAGAATLPSGLPATSLAGAPVGLTPAWALAAAGALGLLGAGAWVLLREPRLARLGARYARADRGAPRTARDPDRRAWDDLDEGRDPTAGPAAGTSADTAPVRETGRVDDP